MDVSTPPNKPTPAQLAWLEETHNLIADVLVPQIRKLTLPDTEDNEIRWFRSQTTLLAGLIEHLVHYWEMAPAAPERVGQERAHLGALLMAVATSDNPSALLDPLRFKDFK